METLNTTFQILKADDNGELQPLFTEIRRNKIVPFSLRCFFTGQVGEEIKFIMWTEGDEEATVIDHGIIFQVNFPISNYGVSDYSAVLSF